MNELQLNKQFKNLLMIMKNTTSTLNLCTHNQSKAYFTDGLVNEIHQCTDDINRLIEEVKKGNITKEMARIDINYWVDNNNWKEAKALYDSTDYPTDFEAQERLREALKTMQKSLGTLHRYLHQAPTECYLRFYEMCFDKEATENVDKDLEHFRAKYMSEEDMPQGLVYYLQRVTYRLFERGFLRFDLNPLQNSHERKFEFDFNLLYREGAESEETKFFCVCLNHYLIMPNTYYVYLNKEKLGKYLFDHYAHLTDSDLYTISYYDVAVSRYNHEVEIRGLLDSEQENETEKNILKQPAAMVLWEKLQKARYIDQSLQPMPNMSNTQLAIIADEFCAKLGIKAKWTYFEKLWNKKNMRGYNSRSLDQENSFLFREEIRQILG